MTSQLPYANLGCGRVIYPGPKADHHVMVDDPIESYPLWTNIDRNPAPGVDCVTDLFRYPWPFEDNSWDGALLCHIVEHISRDIRMAPVGDYAYASAREAESNPRLLQPTVSYQKWIKRHEELSNMQDAWFCFFAELHRCLTPGAMVHILCPYGSSENAWSDPTHTRPIYESTLLHSMVPNPDAPFEYANGGLHFEHRGTRYGIAPEYMHLANKPEHMMEAMRTLRNVVSEIYVKLECVK